jgi:hypothetical protein
MGWANASIAYLALCKHPIGGDICGTVSMTCISAMNRNPWEALNTGILNTGVSSKMIGCGA